MTRNICSWAIVAAVVALAGAAAARAAETPQTGPEQQAKLIQLLKSDAPPADKALACKQLVFCGAKDAVPALAPLLADEQLAAWARIALEAIPDPACDAAFREAAGSLKGRLLVGAINSIGVRRDAAAVELLIPKLSAADVDAACAAAAALGRIGNEKALAALEQALSATTPPVVRGAVAEGCIFGAERMLTDGKNEEAARIYDLVRKADVAQPRVVEATRGAILARKAAGVPMLVELLRSDDKALYALGLSTARELPGREVTDALLAEFSQAAPARQPLLLLALADRGDAAAVPVILQAVKTGSPALQMAAMRVLRQLGDASCLPVLLKIAEEDDAERAKLALVVLSDLSGKEVDAALVDRLATATGKTRQILITLVGRRYIVAAVPTLLKAADDADAATRIAAIAALGSTVDFATLPHLIARVARPAADADEAAAAVKALRGCVQRMPDADACAQKLAGAMAGATPAAQSTLLEVLGVLGGAEALKTVQAAAKGADPQLQDAASRVLGEWMSVDAAPVLADLAQNAPDAKYQIRALRAYLRLARQFVMPDADRLAMCRTALGLASRDAEKKLVLEVLERYPNLEGLRMVAELAQNEALKKDAARAALVIGDKVGTRNKEVQKILAQVGHEPMKVEIVKAVYGAGSQTKDVTDVLQKYAKDFPMIILPKDNYNAAFGGDPAPGIPKQLKVQYRIDGKPGEVTLRENAAILLPVPK